MSEYSLGNILPGAKYKNGVIQTPWGTEVRGQILQHDVVEFDTSYKGEATFSLRQWVFPERGITVWRTYRASGGGLEYTSTSWTYWPYVIS